jgi:archaellum component FlaF (FlaF/FlaG flagellin family)
MKKLKIAVIKSILLLMILWGCGIEGDVSFTPSSSPISTAAHNPSDEVFFTDVLEGITNINQDITIEDLPSEYYDFPERDNVLDGYYVKNNTDATILIPKESLSLAYGYGSETNQWVKVSVEITYVTTPTPYELKPFDNDWVNVGLIRVYLNTPQNLSMEYVRLVVVGESEVDGDSQNVAAWLDVPWPGEE